MPVKPKRGRDEVDPAAVDVVRRLYEAVADRDLESAGECFAANAVWVLPGQSPIAGVHRGWDAIRDDFLAKLGPLSGGTLNVELVDVALGDQSVVAIQHATAQYGGKSLDVTGCQLVKIEDAKIVHVQGHYSDQYAFDAFWAIDAPSKPSPAHGRPTDGLQSAG